jgi:hypothetical protein
MVRIISWTEFIRAHGQRGIAAMFAWVCLGLAMQLRLRRQTCNSNHIPSLFGVLTIHWHWCVVACVVMCLMNAMQNEILPAYADRVPTLQYQWPQLSYLGVLHAVAWSLVVVLDMFFSLLVNLSAAVGRMCCCRHRSARQSHSGVLDTTDAVASQLSGAVSEVSKFCMVEPTVVASRQRCRPWCICEDFGISLCAQRRHRVSIFPVFRDDRTTKTGGILRFMWVVLWWAIMGWAWWTVPYICLMLWTVIVFMRQTSVAISLPSTMGGGGNMSAVNVPDANSKALRASFLLLLIFLALTKIPMILLVVRGMKPVLWPVPHFLSFFSLEHVCLLPILRLAWALSRQESAYDGDISLSPRYEIICVLAAAALSGLSSVCLYRQLYIVAALSLCLLWRPTSEGCHDE